MNNQKTGGRKQEAENVIASFQKAKHSRDLGVYRDSAELKQTSRCSHCSKHCMIFLINV